jgi:hypothetical protein
VTDYDARRDEIMRRVIEAKMCRRMETQFGGRANELEAELRVIYEVDAFGTPLTERRVA